jgi:hypothetical protein
MTPQEKAKELIIKFLKLTSKHEGLETAGLGAITVAKQCALIAVDEMIEEVKLLLFINYTLLNDRLTYWQQVKQEIEKL